MSSCEVTDVSVVIASVNGLPYPLSCLEALQRQDADGISIQVIVADCTGQETIHAVAERFPDVKLLVYDEPKSVPWLRAQGIKAATGRLVAVTEDHCVPPPSWVRQFVDAHCRTGWAAVGGGVENGATDRLIDWTVYFCEYSSLMHPVPAGPDQGVPGMNVAYDMEALAPVRDIFDLGLWENFLHDRLRSEGHVIGLVDEMVIVHDKRFTFRMFLAERYHYSRSFAGMRVVDAPMIGRIGWAAGTVLLPPLLIYRVSRNVIRRRRHVGRLVASFPLVVFFSIVWAVGEFVGYLAGPGDSLVKVR